MVGVLNSGKDIVDCLAFSNEIDGLIRTLKATLEC